MNTQDLAKELKIDVGAVRSKLRREGFTPVNGSSIPDKYIALVCETYKRPYRGRSRETIAAAKKILRSIGPAAKGEALIVKHSEPVTDESPVTNWAKIAAIAPLPLLGLVASYAVFCFALYFVPFWMALLEGASFEVIYISLAALTGLDPAQRKRARIVSRAALIVSCTYGSIAWGLHLMGGNPMENLPLVWIAVFAVLHGVPIPVLADAVANLLLHRK